MFDNIIEVFESIPLIVIFAFMFKNVFGIYFSREKREEYNRNKKIYRQNVDLKWGQYRLDNYQTIEHVTEYTDSNGNTMSRDSYTEIRDPGNRFWSNLITGGILIGISIIIIGLIEEYISKYIAVPIHISTLYLIYKYKKEAFLYERWPMRLIYHIGLFLYFTGGFLQSIGKI